MSFYLTPLEKRLFTLPLVTWKASYNSRGKLGVAHLYLPGSGVSECSRGELAKYGRKVDPAKPDGYYFDSCAACAQKAIKLGLVNTRNL